MVAKTRRGRPVGTTKPRNPKARLNMVNVRVSDEDLVRLKARAEADGVPLSTLIYDAAMRVVFR